MSSNPSRPELVASTLTTLVAAFAGARVDTSPYRHWLLSDVFPYGMAAELRRLPFPRPELGGVSGKRELHNDQRHYFDGANIARFDVCAAVADAFQSQAVVRAIETLTGVGVSGGYVRLEFAQDSNGFWLEPHTDLGVKLFTMLIYLPESSEQADLGTDMYTDPATWSKRPPFCDNSALVFIPGVNTWHGLAPRSFPGVRRSVIMNYVTDDWRAREQLAYPDTPVRA